MQRRTANVNELTIVADDENGAEHDDEDEDAVADPFAPVPAVAASVPVSVLGKRDTTMLAPGDVPLRQKMRPLGAHTSDDTTRPDAGRTPASIGDVGVSTIGTGTDDSSPVIHRGASPVLLLGEYSDAEDALAEEDGDKAAGAAEDDHGGNDDGDADEAPDTHVDVAADPSLRHSDRDRVAGALPSRSAASAATSAVDVSLDFASWMAHSSKQQALQSKRAPPTTAGPSRSGYGAARPLHGKPGRAYTESPPALLPPSPPASPLPSSPPLRAVDPAVVVAKVDASLASRAARKRVRDAPVVVAVTAGPEPGALGTAGRVGAGGYVRPSGKGLPRLAVFRPTPSRAVLANYAAAVESLATGNLERTLHLMREAAAAHGSTAAAAFVALSYLWPMGTQAPDHPRQYGYEMLQANRDPIATLLLALHGEGRPPGLAPAPERVRQAYREVSARADRFARWVTARCQEVGLGCRPDVREAVLAYRQLAADGCPLAQFLEGWANEEGAGCMRNLGRARDLYVCASQAGLSEAMHRLAVSFMRHGDYTSARGHLERAAALGHAGAQFSLYCVLEPRDPRARPLLEAALLQGEDGAQFVLGQECEERGQLDEALRYYEMAAQQNNARALFRAAVLMEGRNDRLSYAYYKAAAELGLPQAKFYQAWCLEVGQGCRQNLECARELYRSIRAEDFAPEDRKIQEQFLNRRRALLGK